MSDKNRKIVEKNSDIEFLNSLLRQPNQPSTSRRKAATRQAPTVVRNTGAIGTEHNTESNTGAISPRSTSSTTHTRNTGVIRTQRNTGAVSTARQTGAVPTQRNTGAVSTARQTGAVPTQRNTGAVSMTQQTSAIRTQRSTGTIRTQRNTDRMQSKRPTGTIARYSVEDDDVYGSFDNQSSVIYTAGTNLFWVILIAIIVWLVVSMAQASPNQSIVSSYSQDSGLRAVAQIIGIQLPEAIAPEPAAKPVIIPPGESTILGAPTITAEQIDAILRANNSPAVGTGQIWVEAGLQYGIDPAYGVAFFMHESSYGTNPAWAGVKPDGSTTHNVGNIICAGYRTCFGRFRDYPDWRTGIYDWYRLIAVEYVQWRGLATVEGILPVYAPAFENDVPRYVNVIKYAVAEWRQANTP
jgi:hypothetical protein